MEPVHHLSLPVRDLREALDFYVGILGCEQGREQDEWGDVWFFGMQVTLQQRPDEVLPAEQVGTRHFGVTLDAASCDALLARLEGRSVDWVHQPMVEHRATPQEQRKAKFRDPSGNVIEVKSYADVDAALRPTTAAPPTARRGTRGRSAGS